MMLWLITLKIINIFQPRGLICERLKKIMLTNLEISDVWINIKFVLCYKSVKLFYFSLPIIFNIFLLLYEDLTFNENILFISSNRFYFYEEEYI